MPIGRMMFKCGNPGCTPNSPNTPSVEVSAKFAYLKNPSNERSTAIGTTRQRRRFRGSDHRRKPNPAEKLTAVENAISSVKRGIPQYP